MNAEQRVALRKKWLELPGAPAKKSRVIRCRHSRFVRSISSDAQFSTSSLTRPCQSKTKVLEKDYTVPVWRLFPPYPGLNETVHRENKGPVMQKKVEPVLKLSRTDTTIYPTVIDVWTKEERRQQRASATWLSGYDIRVSALLIGKHRELRKKVIEPSRLRSSPDKPAA